MIRDLFVRVYYLDGKLDIEATLFCGIINPLRIPRVVYDIIMGIRYKYSFYQIIEWIKTETIPNKE